MVNGKTYVKKDEYSILHYWKITFSIVNGACGRGAPSIMQSRVQNKKGVKAFPLLGQQQQQQQ